MYWLVSFTTLEKAYYYIDSISIIHTYFLLQLQLKTWFQGYTSFTSVPWWRILGQPTKSRSTASCLNWGQLWKVTQGWRACLPWSWRKCCSREKTCPVWTTPDELDVVDYIGGYLIQKEKRRTSDPEILATLSLAATTASVPENSVNKSMIELKNRDGGGY